MHISFTQKAGSAAPISKQPVSLNHGNHIAFEDLDDNTTYIVKLVLFEAHDLSDLSRSPERYFTTNTCEPLGKIRALIYLI
jgi:hypothetical protein